MEVRPIIIRHGWLEFDTVEDYERMREFEKAGKLEDIFRLDKATK